MPEGENSPWGRPRAKKVRLVLNPSGNSFAASCYIFCKFQIYYRPLLIKFLKILYRPVLTKNFPSFLKIKDRNKLKTRIFKPGKKLKSDREK